MQTKPRALCDVSSNRCFDSNQIESLEAVDTFSDRERFRKSVKDRKFALNMREIVHLQAGQCGNQIGAKVYRFYGKFFLKKIKDIGRAVM